MTEPKARTTEKLAFIVLAAISLGACTATTLSTQTDPVGVTEVSKAPVFPDVPLNVDLLSKLMLAELSYFRNDRTQGKNN